MLCQSLCLAGALYREQGLKPRHACWLADLFVEQESLTCRTRLRLALGYATALVIAGVVIVEAGNLLLMLFAGALLAIFLRAISDLLSRHSPLGPKWAYGATVLGIAAACALGGWLLSPQISNQVQKLNTELPGAIQNVRSNLEQYSWGKYVLSQDFDPSSLVEKSGSTIRRVTGAVSTTVTATANVLIVLIFGLYLGAQPELYTRGVLLLMPPHRRERGKEVMEDLRSTLAWWLVGRIASMLIVGVLTTVGLMLLNIPLAITLGIFASLLTFIPNLGPVISAIPAMLLGLVNGPSTAFHVVLLYLGIQMVESYLITPVIQKKAVSLPPVLTLAAQILLGIFFGLLGLVVATPLTAAGLVLVRKLYVEKD